MSRRAAILACVFLVGYAAAAALLWYLAYDTHSDKSRAALIGAATALSAGIAGVMSALITSWRANILEERRALRTLRRDAAARALVGMADMERYANEWRRAKEIKEGLEPGAHAALKAAVETEVQVQRQLRSGAYGATVQALAALRLVSSPKVRAIVDSVRDEAQALETTPNPNFAKLHTLADTLTDTVQ